MTRMTLIVGALVALHVVVGLAGFVAPYDPTSQDRSSPYAPPTALHVMDRDASSLAVAFVRPSKPAFAAE